MADPMRLSHSQQKSLHGCSLSWWIQRRARMPGSTYWSTLAGSVFHERVEHYLLNGRTWPSESVEDHLDRLIADHLRNTPYDAETGIRISKQLPSGLKAQDHPHGFNREAVIAAIPVWIGKWLKWMEEREAEGWRVWKGPDGTLGVEVEVHYTLGGHPVIGSIDCVLENFNSGAIWLVDWKAGRSKPDDTSQLDGYRIGFAETHGLSADKAGFYMARTGKEHLTADLPTFSRSMLDYKFREAGQRAVRAEHGDFEVDPTQCAYLCSVAAFCPVKAGPMSGFVSLPDPVYRGG